MESEGSPAQKLCLACGLCCNGVIFADVRLQKEDDADRIRALGLLKKSKSASLAKVMQPCPAFDGCCKIYCDRPKYCREFECALFKSVDAGHTEPSGALRIINTAHRRAERVRKLLRQLGDEDEKMALSKRFRRVQRRMETTEIDEETADLFGQLTLAMHDLNFLLSEAFYPGRE